MRRSAGHMTTDSRSGSILADGEGPARTATAEKVSRIFMMLACVADVARSATFAPPWSGNHESS
ncbi:MAG: hypothetical protein A4E57_03324 [Syntrophorhabdaceae bacterium PtaU1.Bin034]|jgi:hypothetical protein|nr:MAG: hypothetical protein A4E57_03324 [Syntrophorhabdaceae bacterium PtaU1.Bin034]